ncbi:MAG TPA: hypothetical protein V6C69_13930 [Trichormus sp.]|jgi:hypothetical protein
MDTVTIGLLALGMFITTVLMAIWTVSENPSQSVEDSFRYTTWHMM